MTRSLHDNFVLDYTVDCARRSITIRTEYRDRGEPFERTDVRFEGVLGYFLRDDLTGILFDIEEVPLDQVLDSYAEEFEWGRRYGWPWSIERGEDPREVVAAHDGRAYSIQGSTCFEGFVVARWMTVAAAKSPA